MACIPLNRGEERSSSTSSTASRPRQPYGSSGIPAAHGWRAGTGSGGKAGEGPRTAASGNARRSRRGPRPGTAPPMGARRPRQARARMPQVHGEARRADRRACARRERGDAAQGVRCVREGRCRQGPGISGIVRPGGRRPGRTCEIRALQAEARAARGGAPDARRPPQQARANAGRVARDPGGRRRSRGQEGRARGARAQARHHGGCPRGPGKRDGRRPGKRAHEQGEDPAG